MIQTIQQERAKFALDKVNTAITDNVNQKEFKSYASGLPAMIHMNGLGQAAAFYKSKVKSNEHQILYAILSEWLAAEGQPYYDSSLPTNKKRDLLEGITMLDMATYQLAQAEALALTDWVKKFAKAFMEEE